MVDIARPSQARKKRIRRIIYIGATVLGVLGISVAVSRLRPAAPSVDRAVVWIDTVKRGDFTRQVRGSGVLTPEDIRWIPAQTKGRVEDIVLRPGATVKPDTVILILDDPDVKQAVQDAELAYQASKAAYDNKKADLQSTLLSQEAGVKSIEAQYNQADYDLQANEALFKEGLVAELTVKQKRSAAQDLKNRLASEQDRLRITQQGMAQQIA